MSEKPINVMRPTDEGPRGVKLPLLHSHAMLRPDLGHDHVLVDQDDVLEIQKQLAAAQAENVELRKQLPEGMEHCTIQFRQCSVGHGRLTATNWIDHGCPTCERDTLKAKLAESEQRCANAETVLGKLGWDLTAAGWRDSRAPDSCAGCPNEYLHKVDLEALAVYVANQLSAFGPSLGKQLAMDIRNSQHIGVKTIISTEAE